MRSKVAYMALLVFVFLTMVLVVNYGDTIMKFATYGYIGIFVACAAANSTVFLPAPSSAVVFVMSGVFSPFLVAIVGGLGAATGEVIGYIAGASGRQLLQGDIEGRKAKKVQSLVNRYGLLAVFLFALLPLPLFDLVGVAAGASKMSVLRFFVPCALGKVLKMFVYAYAGAGFLLWISPYIKHLHLINVLLR